MEAVEGSERGMSGMNVSNARVLMCRLWLCVSSLYQSFRVGILRLTAPAMFKCHSDTLYSHTYFGDTHSGTEALKSRVRACVVV